MSHRHNYHILDKFFSAIRTSLAAGTFEKDQQVFLDTYVPELPARTGLGPRVRGYQFKTEGGGKKKNPLAFKSKGFGAGVEVEVEVAGQVGGDGSEDNDDEGGVKIGVGMGGDDGEKVREAEEVGEGRGVDLGLEAGELEERGVGRRVDE